MWEEYKRRSMECKRCDNQKLLDMKAFPLFMKTKPKSTDLLFIFEAPNRDDTYNPVKGYMTVDPHTDPSGSFFHELFINELRLNIDRDLFITNSVLCLPNPKKGKHPVKAIQMKNCLERLREMINIFRPLIVCPLGVKALRATALIEDHAFRTMADAVANPCHWYGRILFPLYHTSSQARNPRNGRKEEMQRADWRGLRKILEEIRQEKSLTGAGRYLES